MANPVCSCCARPVQIVAELRSKPLRMMNGWGKDAARSQRTQPLCEPCFRWLASVVSDVRSGRGVTGLVGEPTPGVRLLMFEDQCSFCHSMPGGTGNLVQFVAAVRTHKTGPPIFTCPSCDLWLAGLAEDGRSARRERDRLIDGPYGAWPHPNLRELSVALAVADGGARTAILEAAAAMGVTVVTQPDAQAVLFIEAGTDLDSITPGRAGDEAARRIFLAPLTARAELRALLANGAMAWLTIPVTPQQVTAALTFTMRQRGLRVRWDPETALPIADTDGLDREAVRCTPAGDADRFELAWLLKRFSRGYDDVVIGNGEIVLLPRTNAGNLGSVIERLEKLLAGRCRFERFEPGSRTRRFDAAG